MAKTNESEQSAAPADPVLEAMLKNISYVVQMTRWEEGWSRRYLAEQSGLSERFIADVEHGKANPSVSSLAALARALHLNVPSMLSGERHVNPQLGQLIAGLDALDQSDLIRHAQATYKGAKASRRVALVGLRGAGKTTVGKLLAQELAVPFVELDRSIEDLAQLPLAQIFEVHGDAHYRKLEGEALRRVLGDHPDVVIATGGGIVSSAETYEFLRARCRTVWLRTKPEDYLARVLKQGDKRPMDRRPQALAELRALLAAREPGYRQAELTVDTTEVDPEDVVRRIGTWLNRATRSRQQDRPS